MRGITLCLDSTLEDTLNLAIKLIPIIWKCRNTFGGLNFPILWTVMDLKIWNPTNFTSHNNNNNSDQYFHSDLLKVETNSLTIIICNCSTTTQSPTYIYKNLTNSAFKDTKIWFPEGVLLQFFTVYMKY